MNIVSFRLDKGYLRLFIVGCYLALEDSYNIERVVGSMKQCPCGAVIMVVRDLKTDITELEANQRDEAISTALADAGLEETSC